MDYESARELVYGEPYESWKNKYINTPKIELKENQEHKQFLYGIN